MATQTRTCKNCGHEVERHDPGVACLHGWDVGGERCWCMDVNFPELVRVVTP